MHRLALQLPDLGTPGTPGESLALALALALAAALALA